MKRLLILAVIIAIVAMLAIAVWRRWQPGASRERSSAMLTSSGQAWLLLLLPLPVAAAAVVSLARGQLLPLLGNSLGYGLFLAGALLVRRGRLSGSTIIGERWPWRTLGAGLIALATATTAWLGVGHHPAIAAVFGLTALLGCYLTYGFDSILISGGHRISGHALATLADAERSIVAIEQASHELRQPELDARLRRIAELARGILQRIKDDPRDLRQARRFLNLYLDGVQRVVEGYVRTHGRIAAPQLEERFRHALVTIEDAFQAQQQTLLQSDLDDLDIQIEVLTEQLKREGII
jgi:hypothetical protein